MTDIKSVQDICEAYEAGKEQGLISRDTKDCDAKARQGYASKEHRTAYRLGFKNGQRKRLPPVLLFIDEQRHPVPAPALAFPFGSNAKEDTQ